MTTRDEFISDEILPTLDGYAEDFDIDAICDEVSEYDPREGYVWKEEYRDDETAYWEVVRSHDVSEG